jgi:hypothetical protein
MKQTVEEAARDAIHAHYKCNGEYPCGERDYCEHCNGHNTAFDCCECGADEFKEGFISGAEWQSKQSPWISVKDKAGCDTSDDCIVMVANGDIFKAYFSSKNKWMKSNGGYYDEVIDDVVAWMPIPSFDDILEANKDVLERIKEKGD